MKKKIFQYAGVLFCAAYLIFGMMPACSEAVSLIGEERAKQIAFQHAGASESGARILKLGLDNDHGHTEYEIDFVFGDFKYEYGIDAVSGAVRKFGKKAGYGTAAHAQYIGPQAAEKIAFDHAKVKRGDVLYLRTKLDHDDGMVKYEVKFFCNGLKYEYDIEAKTGQILEFEQDND